MMIITIPNYKAPSWNDLYEGGHWAKRKQMADEIHELVAGSLLSRQLTTGSFNKSRKAVITITAFFKSRPIDPDNIMAKLWIDGLKDKVIINDSPFYVDSVTTKSRTDITNHVVIEVSEMR